MTPVAPDNSRSGPPVFTGGPNIAVKVPPHQYEATVDFYRDVLGLSLRKRGTQSVCFDFGAARLWVDRVPALSHSEVWLEVSTPDRDAASAHLHSHGVPRRDEIEPLPDEVEGFWVADPSGNILLVHEPDESAG